jgi:hypothetical protein
MQVWIDKQGGSHYHTEDCLMVKDPMFHYEQYRVGISPLGKEMPTIRIGRKYYMPDICILKKYKVESFRNT